MAILDKGSGAANRPARTVPAKILAAEQQARAKRTDDEDRIDRYRAGVRALIGSPRTDVDLAADPAFQAELDELTIRNYAWREALGYPVPSAEHTRTEGADESAGRRERQPVGGSESSSDTLRERRYALLDEYQRANGLTTRRELCRELGMSRDTLGGIVRNERKKYGPEKQAQLLDALQVSLEEWNNPQ